MNDLKTNALLLMLIFSCLTCFAQEIKYTTDVSYCISGDCENGFGQKQFPSSIIEGNFVNGNIEGKGTETWDDGGTFNGFYSNGFRVNGKSIWNDGNVYIGEWNKGKKNGQGIFSWASGTVYVGAWKDNKMNGFGTLHWADGISFVGEFQDDERINGKILFLDGTSYDGQWKDNKMHGKGTYTWFSGSKYVGDFKNDDFNGIGKYYNKNGDIQIEGTFKNGEFVE